MRKYTLKRDVIGTKIKNVTVISRSGFTPSGGIKMLVKCVCGELFDVPLVGLYRAMKPEAKHRLPCPTCSVRFNITRRSYSAMLWQTGVPRRPSRRKRGFRAAPPAARWKDSYDAFLEDMGPRPANHVLDRKDNALGYSKENCRWASYKLSTENRRNTVWLNIDGEKIRVEDAAKKYGTTASAIYQRIYKGWTHKEAVRSINSPGLRRGMLISARAIKRGETLQPFQP